MSDRKWSETAVGLEEGVGLSTGRRCSLSGIVLTKKTLPSIVLSKFLQVIFLLNGPARAVTLIKVGQKDNFLYQALFQHQ